MVRASRELALLKRDELARTAPPLEIEIMRRLKAALDPQGLLNPGKVL